MAGFTINISSLAGKLPTVSNPTSRSFGRVAGFEFAWNDAYLKEYIAAALGESVFDTRKAATGFATSSTVRKGMFHKTYYGAGYGIVGSRSPISHLIEGGTGIFGPFHRPFTITAGAVPAERRVGSHRKGTQSRDIVKKRGGKKALYWQGARHPVVATTERGMRAKPFLQPAADLFPTFFVAALRKRFVS